MSCTGSNALRSGLFIIIAVLLGCTPSPPPTSVNPDGGGGANATGATTSMSSSHTATAGSSSTGASSSSGGWDASSWLNDPDLWVPVNSATEKLCGIHQAKLPSPKVPRRTWSPCADGCLVTPINIPDAGTLGALTNAVAGTELNGDIYYRVSAHGMMGGVDDMVRLSDGEPVAVLKKAYGCPGTGVGPFLFKIYRITPEGEPIPLQSIGQASPQVGAPITWALPGLDVTAGLLTGYFDFNSGWGVIRDYSTVEVALTPTSSALSTIWSSPAPQVNATARDDIVVWSDYSGWSTASRSKLRVYTPSGGTAILLQGLTGDVVESALTADRLVWLEATGVLAGQGAYESAQLFWSPKTTNPADVQRNAGPTLPHTKTAGTPLTASGAYGAVVVGF